MPKVEIDEAEFQRDQNLRKTVDAIMANPKARRKFLEGYKTVKPDAQLPELEETETEKQLRELRESLSAEKKAREEAEAKAAQDRKLSDLASTRASQEASLRADKWTEEGITKVKEFAEKQGILDLTVAAAAFEKLHPPADLIVPKSTSGGWDFMQPLPDGDKDSKFVEALVKSRGENEPLLAQRTQEALAEVRGQRR